MSLTKNGQKSLKNRADGLEGKQFLPFSAKSQFVMTLLFSCLVIWKNWKKNRSFFTSNFRVATAPPYRIGSVANNI
jgi:hypothetical protein